MNEIQAINKYRKQLIDGGYNSFEMLFSGPSTTIEKSMDAFVYSTEVVFPKTGKELTDAIMRKKTDLETRLTILIAEKESLKREIGCEPKDEDYHLAASQHDHAYKRTLYSWEQREECREVGDEKCFEMMDRYNQRARECADIQFDINSFETMLRNIKPAKQYKLNLRQLMFLNF